MWKMWEVLGRTAFWAFSTLCGSVENDVDGVNICMPK